MARGLRTWFDQLETDRRWTHLPAVVPGEVATEIETVYVELFAIADRDVVDLKRLSGSAFRRQSTRKSAGEYPVLSAPSMVARTLQRCVVLGEPGSGKSTLVQWLAQAVRKGECPDYDIALVVKLSRFASAIQQSPRLTLVEFFFETLDAGAADWRTAADWLRHVASARHRCLLLLDGWDEVPLGQRDLVWQRIETEQTHFVTLVTSRASGRVPRLRGQTGDDLYHLAGLTSQATEQLTRNLLGIAGCAELADHVLERIRDEPDLGEMAANPFLL